MSSSDLYQFRMPNDFLQTVYTDFAQILSHLLSEEREEVHYVLGATFEVLAQLWVLSGDAHRAGVRVAFAHHHATQHYQRQRAERELIGTEHRHDDYILGGLQLSIGLQTYLIS